MLAVAYRTAVRKASAPVAASRGRISQWASLAVLFGAGPWHIGRN
jgi:hypothetical protein